MKHDDQNELRGARIYAGRDSNGDKVISKNEWTLVNYLAGPGSPVPGTLTFPVFEGEDDVLAYRIAVECVHSKPTYCQLGNVDLLCEDPPGEAGDGIQTSAGLR